MISRMPGFFTSEDCAAVLSLVDGMLKPSTVRSEAGRAVAAEYRNSRQAIVPASSLVSGFIGNLAEALPPLVDGQADFGGIELNVDPVGVAQFEQPHVVEYLAGQRYGMHHDNPQSGQARQRLMRSGGERLFTVVVGLTDEYEGGEIWFPEWNETVRVAAGELVYWRNLPSARHEVLPVTSGRKAVLVTFVRERPYLEAEDAAQP